jgi:hypothetical protein
MTSVFHSRHNPVSFYYRPYFQLINQMLEFTVHLEEKYVDSAPSVFCRFGLMIFTEIFDNFSYKLSAFNSKSYPYLTRTSSYFNPKSVGPNNGKRHPG